MFGSIKIGGRGQHQRWVRSGLARVNGAGGGAFVTGSQVA
jgi:hypothetical protein